MAQLYVANVNFESTGNNQLAYSSNSITVRLGGANVLTVNSSGITPNSSLTVPANTTFLSSNVVATVNSSVTVSGAVIIDGKVTPTAIAANTSNWAPGIGNVYSIRVSSNTNVVNSEFMITGMTAGTNGQLVVLHNVGAMGIWIRNEEAGSNSVFFAGVNTPSSTAANRFNMPNHFKLQGYQSAMFYYDGALQRWRPTDSNSIAFDHKKALTKAFFSGGTTTSPTVVATADRTTYSTEATAAVVGANLSQARLGVAGVGNAEKGFFAGGSDGAAIPTTVYYATADRTIYSTEATAAVTGANLSTARRYAGGAGNACKGFVIGGGAAGASAVADKTTYATETTAAVPTANLPTARNRVSASGNTCKSFNSGGEGPVNTSDRTTYSTETTAAVPGANLSQARDHTASASSDDKGFFIGGRTPTLVTTADRTTFSTETTAAVPGANLNLFGRSSFSAAGNSCKGFFSGGINPAAAATANRTTYSTETTAAVPGANLSQARSLQGAI